MTPYEREMRLMPHIMKMERAGVNVDIGKLAYDTDYYFKVLARIDDETMQILGRNVDIDSNENLADAIQARFPHAKFATTPTGKRSTAKESLMGAIEHPVLLGHLLCRGALATCLRTFYQPWLTQAQHHGKLFIRWNQFRNYTDTGARTGRISSSPNLQNVPVTWEKLKSQLETIGYKPTFELPMMRQYIVPAPGHVFIGRDYSAQELRLLAHFAGGSLLETLIADPAADVHQIAAKLAGISRKEAKTLAFAILYGAGVGRIAESLGISVAAATMIKRQYLERLPEIKRFTKELTALSDMGQPITTLAGRQYYAQAPAVVQGRLRTFEYKLANYKIQGSAADQTKEAMYDYATKTQWGRIVLSVHDQLVVEVPEEHLESERMIFEQAMNGAFQEVLKYKIISDEEIGHSFGALKTESEKPMPTTSAVGGIIHQGAL